MFLLNHKFYKALTFGLSFWFSLTILLLFVMVIMLLSPNIANGYDPAFAWNANTEPDVAGYYIYYKTGASGAPYNGKGADEGNSPIQIPLASLGDPTTPQYTIHGLNDTETYFFVITAYDIYGNESGYSNELESSHENVGISQGCYLNPLLYCPDDPMTRAQMAVFLGRSIHGSEFTPPPATGIFNDVSSSHWAADWIEQLYQEGITEGCGLNPLMYCPDKPVTRAQIAIFLLRVKHGINYTPPPATGIFNDVSSSHWAADWIEQLYQENITEGCGLNPLMYCPDKPVTPAQMTVFLIRIFGL